MECDLSGPISAPFPITALRLWIHHHLLSWPEIIACGFGVLAGACVVAMGVLTLPIHRAGVPFWLHGAVIAIITGVLVFGMTHWLVRELRHQKWAEEALRRANERLEDRVEQRTAALAAANELLRQQIAERKRAEEALVRSEKLAAAGRLAATIAHEINNPLEVMTNIVYLLERSVSDPAARKYVAMLDHQVSTISRIAVQTLKFHRESSRPAEFDLSALVAELLEFYAARAKTQGVTLTERGLANAGIFGFSSDTRQVISNLLLNAIEATPAGGRVTVKLSGIVGRRPPEAGGYRVTIGDNGTGIDPDHRSRIFEPFFTTKGERGTGLGLWVSLGIVSRIGGSIRMRSSRRPGRSGTCFSLFLPMAAPAAETPARRRYEEAATG